MKRASVVASLLLAAAPAAADVVVLRGGGELRGEVVERRADAVVVETGPGRVTLPMSRVERIVMGSTPLAEYRARAAVLSPRDAHGWLTLARWAEGKSLLTQAREAYERALAADPKSADAHAGLGHVAVGGEWLSQAEANRARGLVEFEGAWITARERVAILSERAALAHERQVARETDARVRAAEADARRAEADARRAEAEAELATARPASEGMEGGIPYPWIFDPPYGGAIIVPGPISGPQPPVRPHARGHRGRRGSPDDDPQVVAPSRHKPTRDNGARDNDAPRRNDPSDRGKDSSDRRKDSTAGFR
jgi:hypothetical protein